MTKPDASKYETDINTEPLFEKLFESSPDGILVTNADGEIIRVNGQAEKTFGYNRGELLGRPIEVLVSERYRDGHPVFRRNYMANVSVRSMNVSLEAHGRRSDGTEFPAEIMLSPILEAGNGPLVLAVVRDITERKQAETGRHESEDFLANVVNAIADPVFVKDGQHRWVVLNDAYCSLMQHRREELIGKSDYDFFPKKEADVFWAKDNIVFETGEGNTNEESFTDAEGTTHTIVTRKSLYTSRAGKQFIVGVIRDITERKRTEEALRDREQQLQSILDNSATLIFLKDRDGRFLRINHQFEKAFGVTQEQILGKTPHVLFPKEQADRLRSHDAKVLEAGAPMEFEEIVRQDDGLHTYIAVKFPLFDSSGKAYAVCGISTDITERKLAENALREREQLLESILDNSTAVIFLKDRNGRYLRVNRQYETLFGITREQIVGKNDYDLFPKDKADLLRANDLKVLETGCSMEFEEVVPQSDGLHTYIAIKFPIFDAAGVPRAVGGIATDITERKKTEAALLLEVTNVLVSNLDVRKLFTAVSASIRQVVAHDFASLALYDPESGKLRIQRLSSPGDKEPKSPEVLLPIDGSPAGWVFTIREPVVLNQMDTNRFPPEMMRRAELLHRWIRLGVKSACWLPLIHGGSALGVLLVASLEEGAFPDDKVRLLIQVANQVAVALDNALAFRQIAGAMDRLAQEKLYLEDELKTEYNFEEIIGESAALKRVLNQVETVAQTDATVLNLGDTGTGQELIARAIHNLSPRRERTFVKLNCAAVPSGLLESELFGHEKGAFTGAIARKIGRLEVANGGTLLLDEIGDIPLELQPKLLRALQEKEFERLGSTRTIPVDVRLIAATNRDLAQMVNDGRFRRDLFYRLSVIPVTIPPLRDRKEDIPLLVHYFLQKHAKRSDKPIQTVSPGVMQAMVRWHWPGNVRELENLIERAVILTKGPELRIPISELTASDDAPAPSDSSPTLENVEREHILQVLRETRGQVGGPQGAAAKLGLKRTTLNFKMRKLGITREDL